MMDNKKNLTFKSLSNLLLTVFFSLFIIYGRAQVVINEVQMQPAGSTTGTNPQNLADCTPNNGGEFVELYNTDPCNPVDISCYIIGCNIAGTSAASHGAFRFPQGTIIPPLGFISIGGTNSGATFVLNTYCGTANLNINPAGRWYMPNGDGYMMLYNASGTVIDAVYWTINAGEANKWGTDTDINTNPTRIPSGTGGCALVNSLSGPATLPISAAEYAGQSSGNGFSTARQTDGSATWVRNVAGTINACNGACVVSNPFNLSISTSNPTCSASNGSITITPNPAGAYTYGWTPVVSSTNSASNLEAGTYQISIVLNGCQKDTSVELTSSAGPTSILVTPINPACNQSNGSVSLGSVTGGTGPYTYNFNNQGYSATTNYNNLAAGNYTLLVKDASGCIYNAPNITLSSLAGPTAIVVTPSNPTCGLGNGSVTLGAVTGGTAPYTYNFNNLGFAGATNFSNLLAGTYSLLVQDASGCTYTAPAIVLTSSSGPTAIGVTPVNPSCGQANGAVSLGSVTGGTAPFTYNFNNLGFVGTTNFSNLAAGTYSLLVQDASGCTYTAPSIALTSSSGPTAIIVTSVNPSCGQANGAITLGAVSGGTAPYTYNFNNLGFSGTSSFANLASGTYSLDVRDANGCIYSAPTIGLNSTNGPTAIAVSSFNPSCGQSDGSITLGVVTGGTAPYTFNLNNTGFIDSSSFSNLAAGSYSLEVKDANGCVYSAPSIALTNVNGPSSVIVNSINSICSQPNGSVAIGTVTGGTGPYTYNFNNLGYSSATSYSNLSAGSYNLLVMDAGGCVYPAPPISISTTTGPTAIAITTVDPTCGQTNGSVTLGNVTGGSAPFTYNFNNLGYSSITTFTTLPSGQYPLTVADASGCIFTAPLITLNSSNGPNSIAVSTIDPSCAQSNGTISLGSVSGGSSPYTYNLNGQGFSATTTYQNLPSGTYTLQVIDAVGCVFVAPDIVLLSSNGPNIVQILGTNTSCGQVNGAISIGDVTGGETPYLYSFDNQPFSASNSIQALTSGLHTITVQDANNCTFDTSITILPSTGISNATVTTSPAICLQSNGLIQIDSVLGGNPPYQYQLNNQGFSPISQFSNLAHGMYSLTIEDVNGCLLTIQKFLSQDFTSGPQSINYAIISPDCGEVNGSIAILNVLGGTQPFTYTFSGSVSMIDSMYTNLDTGFYYINLSDSNGCELSDSVFIKQNNIGGIYAPNSFTPNKDGKNEKWFINGYCIKHIDCIIFNRWGEYIARLDDENPEWDGIYNGEPVKEGVYVYNALITFESNDTQTVMGYIFITY